MYFIIVIYLRFNYHALILIVYSFFALSFLILESFLIPFILFIWKIRTNSN